MSTEVIKPEVQQLESGLTVLKQRLDAITVRDQESYVICSAIELEGKAYIKRVGFELDPGIAKVKDSLDHLKNQKEKFVGPAKLIVEAAVKKGNDWKEEERRKAAAEQERINAQLRAEAARKAEEERREAEAKAKADREERERQLAEARKAGEIGKREEARLAKEAAQREAEAKELAAKQAAETAANVKEVEVKASLPTVAGKKNQQYFFAEVPPDNEAQVIDAFLAGNTFLRKFIQVNQQEVGKYARDTQDTKKVIAAIPGVKAWSKG